MAQLPSDSQLVVAVSTEEELINKKKEVTGDPNWEPKSDGEGHGPGFIPEEVWKKMYSPDSKEETEVKPENG